MRESNKASHFFVDKYMEIMKIHPDIREELGDDYVRLNRILQRENLRIDLDGNTLFINPGTTEEKKEKTNETNGDVGTGEKSDTKISNFCVIPTHRLYMKNENGIYEDGIGVKIFARVSKKKYKCIYLNLSNEMIEKGYWISPVYLDHDFYLYNKSFYKELRIALKLSIRMLSSDEFKVFDGEWWFENRFSDVEISDFEGFPKSNTIQWLAHPSTTNGEIKQFHIFESNEEGKGGTSEIIKQDIFYFLKAVNELVKKELILDKGDIPDSDNENIGWKDNEKYYLFYGKTWEWVENFLNKSSYQISIPNKEFDIKLYEEGIIDIEEEKRTGRKRADCNIKKNKRCFKISISRLNEFIDTYNDLVNH